MIQYTVPGTSRSLTDAPDGLHSPDGDEVYPLVKGVPMLFPAGATPTFDAYRWSQEAIDRSDPWQVDTLAIDPPQKAAVREALQSNGKPPVDPVISYLVLATNGIAFESSLGKLADYPIPELPLPPARGESLLDIGCSWGRWCASAARLGYAVCGIDPSLGAVLAAGRMFRQFGLQGDFACGDGRLLPYPDDRFDVVHSYSVLQHFSDADVEKTWSEIGRVLKPGGRAVVQMASALGLRSFYHLCRRHFRTPKVFEVRYRLPAQLKRLGEKYVGPTELSIDCFGGLGLQQSDVQFYSRMARYAVKLSEKLKHMAQWMPPLRLLADSQYVYSIKRSLDERESGNDA